MSTADSEWLVLEIAWANAKEIYFENPAYLPAERNMLPEGKEILSGDLVFAKVKYYDVHKMRKEIVALKSL